MKKKSDPGPETKKGGGTASTKAKGKGNREEGGTTPRDSPVGVSKVRRCSQS